MPLSRLRPEFFVDRSLARRTVATMLREVGWSLHTHIEVYGSRDQEVPDAEWLELCGRNDWIALTMDRGIRYHRAEVAAIRRHRVKAFVLAGGNLRAIEQARRFIDNEAAIVAACFEAGPFVYAVRSDGIVRIFPS